SLRSDIQQATSTSDVQRAYKVEEFLQEQLPRLPPDLDRTLWSPLPTPHQRSGSHRGALLAERAVAARTKEELLRSKSKVRGDPPVARTIRQELQSVVGLLSMLRRETAALRTLLTGHMELDADLLEVLDGILGNYLPNAWRRASFPCSKPLLAWAFDVRSRLQWLQTTWERLCSGSEPFCFRLDLLWRPRALLLATLRAAARVQELPLE
ncbi:DNAH6, partial [Symbiodinium sp. KB8]